MEKRRRKPRTIERSLWHGTSADAIWNINKGGFNRSYCGKNSTAYGEGVYFAVNSSYSAQGYASPDASGHMRMYRSLVLTGDYTTGDSYMRVLPNNPNNRGFPFDSAVDDPGSPNMFVVFLDNMAYPEYLVTFT
ncbi:Protein mono-ADP-ribosyltransferase PARP14 [Lamellibrachia satsuma]|nr:Protein mono-ADP-ribosyltransferase PARP14 [Lamellibrachia satsuma]